MGVCSHWSFILFKKIRDSIVANQPGHERATAQLDQERTLAAQPKAHSSNCAVLLSMIDLATKILKSLLH